MKEIAKRIVSGDEFTGREIQGIFDSLNGIQNSITLKRGWVVEYSLMREYNVRTGQGKVRYLEFASEDEAEKFLNSLSSRTGKWEWGRYLARDIWYIKKAVADYKGDYEKIFFIAGEEQLMSCFQQASQEYLQKYDEGLIRGKYFIAYGEVFNSKGEMEVRFPDIHPGDYRVVNQEDVEKTTSAQKERMDAGTYGD